jgi:Protein of unknown function (DUF2510)
MAWNILNIVEHDIDNGPLYPIATTRSPGFALWVGETVIRKEEFGLLTLYRRSANGWEQTYYTVGNAGKLYITNLRFVVVFEKVPKSRSFFRPIAVGQAIADIGKHRGESFVGHIPYDAIAAIAARRRSVGMPPTNQGMLRVIAVDATGGNPTMVMVEINKDKSPDLASALAQALATYRASAPAFAAFATEQATWYANATSSYTGEPKVFVSKSYAPYRYMGRADITVDAQVPPADEATPRQDQPAAATSVSAAPFAPPAAAATSVQESPARWAPDPYARHQLRYWDGSTWTEHVSDQGVTGIDHPQSAPP